MSAADPWAITGVGLDDGDGGLDDGLDGPKKGDDDDAMGLDEELAVEEKKVEDASDALRLRDALKPLAGGSRFSDVTFIVDGERIPGHKVILAGRSRVFEAMLYPSFDEEPKVPLEIEIKGVEAKVFRKLLQAVYTDNAELDAETIGGALRAAQRFQVESLRLECLRFKDEGITATNACALFESAPEDLGDPTFGLKFIEENTETVVQSPTFTTLSESRLIAILQSDRLSIDELDLFKALLRWAAAEIKRRDLPGGASPENTQKVLENAVNHVRFPTMEMADIATVVAASGVLKPDQMLEIYTFLGSGRNEALAATMKFNTKDRVGSGMNKWSFKDTHSLGVSVTSNHVVKVTGPRGYIIGNTEFKKGKKYAWRVHLDQMQGTSWVLLAVSHKKVFNQNSYSDPSVYGWCSASQTYTGGRNAGGVNTNWSAGTVVDMMYDGKKNQLSCYSHMSKVTLSMAVSSSAPLVPHFSLYTQNQITAYPIAVKEFATSKTITKPKFRQ